MNEYDTYMMTINNIFKDIEELKNGYRTPDNMSYINNIFEYKDALVKGLSNFSKEKKVDISQELLSVLSTPKESISTSQKIEELGL